MREHAFLKQAVFALLLVLSVLFVIPAIASDSDSVPVLVRYEALISQAEKAGVYSQNDQAILFLIDQTHQAILENKLEHASQLIDNIQPKLEALSKRPPGYIEQEMAVQGLKMFRDITQGFIFTLLIVFLAMRFPVTRKRILKPIPFGASYLNFIGLTSLVAIICYFYDFSRYGASALAFFELHVVVLILVGLLAGFFSSLICAIFVVLATVFTPEHYGVSIAVSLGAALIGPSLMSLRKEKIPSISTCLLAGVGASALQAAFASAMMPESTEFVYRMGGVFLIVMTETGCIFLCMILVFQIMNDEESQLLQTELLKTKLQFLQAQLNPHFLYNSLNTISAICSREKAPEAQKLVLRLADFFRGSLRKGGAEVTLREEIEHIESYLDIEKARFQNNLEITKTFDLSAFAWRIEIPFLLLQPLVENAIKHGISKRDSGGVLRLSLAEDRDKIYFKVEDNGPAIDLKKIERVLAGENVADSTGIGLQNTRERMERALFVSHGLHFERTPEGFSVVFVEIPKQINQNKKG